MVQAGDLFVRNIEPGDKVRFTYEGTLGAAGTHYAYILGNQEPLRIDEASEVQLIEKARPERKFADGAKVTVESGADYTVVSAQWSVKCAAWDYALRHVSHGGETLTLEHHLVPTPPARKFADGDAVAAENSLGMRHTVVSAEWKQEYWYYRLRTIDLKTIYRYEPELVAAPRRVIPDGTFVSHPDSTQIYQSIGDGRFRVVAGHNGASAADDPYLQKACAEWVNELEILEFR